MNMKQLILISLLVIFASSSLAQTKGTLIFGEAVTKYQKMERAGTVLTLVGGAALFTGNLLYRKTYNDYDYGEAPQSKVRTSKYVMFGGIGLIAVGVPVWAIGKSKERRITIQAQIVNFKGLASANGVGLKIRF
jgi:hypothetical protein